MKQFLILSLSLLMVLSLAACDLASLLPLPAPNGGIEEEPYIPDDTSYGYYYDQLSEDAKTVYRSIYKDPTNTEGVTIILKEPLLFTEAAEGEADDEIRETLTNITQPAMDALLYDHPEIYWVRMGDAGGSTFTIKHRSTENEDGTLTVSVRKLIFKLATKHIDEGKTIADEARLLAEVIAAYEITGVTRAEKLRSMCDLLAARVTYDKEADRQHIAAGALIDGRAVCDGYAKAIKLLCDREGIPCVIVAGTAVQSGNTDLHAWNCVQLEDGLWYALDATWDDRGDYAVSSYFLLGSASVIGGVPFSESHLPRGIFSNGEYTPFTHPILSNEAYIQESNPSVEPMDLILFLGLISAKKCGILHK